MDSNCSQHIIQSFKFNQSSSISMSVYLCKKYTKINWAWLHCQFFILLFKIFFIKCVFSFNFNRKKAEILFCYSSFFVFSTSNMFNRTQSGFPFNISIRFMLYYNKRLIKTNDALYLFYAPSSLFLSPPKKSARWKFVGLEWWDFKSGGLTQSEIDNEVVLVFIHLFI